MPQKKGAAQMFASVGDNLSPRNDNITRPSEMISGETFIRNPEKPRGPDVYIRYRTVGLVEQLKE